MQVTTALNKIAALPNRVKVIQGGQGASKTFSIMMLAVNHCFTEPGRLFTVVAESMPKQKRGAIRDFKAIMQGAELWDRSSWNSTESTYNFPNGSIMEFVSGDKPDKFRGARRTDLFINEAESVSFELYQQTSARTSGNVFIDYNPSHEFWVHEHIIGNDDTDFLILTYRDNEAIPEAEKKFIENMKAKADMEEEQGYYSNWYDVYGLGQLGTLQGAVITNWTQVDQAEFDKAWNEGKHNANGLDFGFTIDPAGLVKFVYYDGAIWLDELIYETGLTNQDICDSMRRIGIPGHEEIIADSAEPKSIEEISRQGFFIMPSVKGPDSLRYGIGILRQYPIRVTKNSVNLIKELRSYVWQEKDGKKLSKPIDAYNHLIDAARYVASIKLGTPQTQWHDTLT